MARLQRVASLARLGWILRSQDKGVTVHLFDRDLQEDIRAANKTFIEQAAARALAAAQETKPIVLSALEAGLPSARMDELSKEALAQYRQAIGITDPIDSDAFLRRLLAHGLLEERDGKLVPTGFGMAAERKGWAWLGAKDGVTVPEYVKALGLPERSARRHLQQFVELGLVRRHGQGRATTYEVIRP